MRLLPAAWQPQAGRGLDVFPWIFNVADSLLCVGVTAMVLFTFVAELRRKRAAERGEHDDHARLDAATPEKA